MSLLIGPRPFLDANGDPASGGRVYFYDTGTTTPKAVYADRALTVALANPLTLDAAGHLSTLVFAGDGERFTIDAQNSAGASLPGFPANDYWGKIEAVAGSTYTPNGSSATRTIQSKLDEIVSLADHGAVGDDATINTTAIQAALDTGEDIFVPDGVFVTAKVTMSSNQRLYGPGTLKLADGSDTALLEIPAGASGIDIEHITLDGNWANNTGVGTNIGVLHLASTAASPVSDVWIRRVTVKNGYRKLITFQDGCTNCHIRDGFGDYTDQEGGFDLSSNGTTQNVSCIGCTVNNTQAANILANATVKGCVISNNICGANNQGSGSTLGDNITGYNPDNENMVVEGNRCYDSANNGIHVGSDDCTVNSNNVENATFYGVTVWLSSVTPAAQGSRATVNGNVIRAPGTTGIAVFNYQFVTIASNVVTGGGTYGILHQQDTTTSAADKFTIANNTVNGFTNDLVRIEGDVNDGSIVGNTLTDGSADGIQFSGGTNGPRNVHVTGNRVKGCVVGLRENLGANNSVQSNNFEGCTTGITLLSGSGTICSNNVPAISTGFYTTAVVGSGQTVDLPADARFHRLSAAAAATINDITPKWADREILVYFVDGNITFNTASSTLFLSGGTDKTGSANDIMRLVCDGTNWFQASELVANA